MSRGQIVSIDLVFGLFVFLILFGFMVFSWYSNLVKISSIDSLHESQLLVENIADGLVLSSGNPSNWHSLPDYNFPGLVYSKRLISSKRLAAFSSANYSALRSKLSVEDYNFYFKIEQSYNIVFEKGQTVPGNEIVSSQRIVDFNGSPAILTFTLFR